MLLGRAVSSPTGTTNFIAAAQQRLADPGTTTTAENPAPVGGTTLIHPDLTPNLPGNPEPDSYVNAIAQQQNIAAAAQQRLEAQQQAQLAAQTSALPSYSAAGSVGASSPYTVPNVGGGLSPEGFAREILEGEGIKATPGSLSALERWEAQEGGNWHNSASYNPLNTTQSEPGYHETGSQGNIGAYNSWDQGLKATLETLNNGRYGAILQALRQGNYRGVLDAIDNSSWGTKGL